MFQPTPQVLKKYADVFIKWALNSWEGIKPGETVLITVPECAKPLLLPLQQATLEAGGNPVIEYLPDGLQKNFFDHANSDQIEYRPTERILGTVKDIDHRMYIIAEADKYETSGVDAKKIMDRFKTIKFYREALQKKEQEWNLTWTLGMYATPSMAADVGLSLEEYWWEIIHACYLDHDDPVSQWKKTTQEIQEIGQKLSDLKIQKVHVTWEDADLHVQIGSDRKWLCGRGCNVPSFEIFTSPDWRSTNGWIRFNMPLYYQSNVIKGIRLEFKDGIITSATAKENEALLKEMIAQEDANKVGEYSLTDRRHSRITKFMGETLYDENVWGPFGNTHLAVGMAYKEAFTGNIENTTKEQWEAMGFNDSVVHTDIMQTTDRTVSATLEDGSEIIIYQGWEFQV